MNQKESDSHSSGKRKTKRIKLIDYLLKILAFFVILEPIWMLLPFAGFLYGSVMHIELLSKNPYTSWLVHFVFPTHTLFPLGMILIITGILFFLIGAFQIYTAKLFKKGLVKTGIYRKFRNPQYVALTLFGLGIILTWGRFITFISFFIMMWLYYYLSKSEEKKCLELFGEEYEEYRKSTYFIFPGEKLITRLINYFPEFKGRGPVFAAVSFIIILSLSAGGGLAIQKIKFALKKSLPVIEDEIELSGNKEGDTRILMVKGPVLQAAPVDRLKEPYFNKIFEMVTSSQKIRHELDQLNLTEHQSLLVFSTPGNNWHKGLFRDYRNAKFNAFIFVTETGKSLTRDNFWDLKNDMRIIKLIKAEEISYNRVKKGLDPVGGKIFLLGPPTGIISYSFQNNMTERINFFLSGI